MILGRYLISVITNTAGQSCNLQIGQSSDTFFTSIKSSFPIENFAIDTICNTTNNLPERMSKLATDFLNLINSKYLVGLITGETIKTAKVKLAGSSTFNSIFEGIDFKLEKGQLILLKPSLNNFLSIELEIVK